MSRLLSLFFLTVLSLSLLAASQPIIEDRADSYSVAAVDQNSKTVRVFPRDKKWNKDAISWSFMAESAWWDIKNRWDDLSDVKVRKVAKHGWIALVTASGGKAGIINITNEKRSVTLDDDEVLWQATPGGNPHAIERIPYNGAIVVASSKTGRLTLYVPTGKDINDYSKIKKSQFHYELDGAHGVLWDPNGSSSVSKGFLWAVGREYLYKYRVEGSGKSTRLVRDEKKYRIPGGGLGHDLQPDFGNKNSLLVTDSYGAYAFNTKSNKWTTLKKMKKIKSLARHENGEYMWVTGNKDELGQYVEFAKSVGAKKSTKRGWSAARFYKARFYRTDFD